MRCRSRSHYAPAGSRAVSHRLRGPGFGGPAGTVLLGIAAAAVGTDDRRGRAVAGVFRRPDAADRPGTRWLPQPRLRCAARPRAGPTARPVGIAVAAGR